ncbi:hypothetical protein HELRODRAFT_98295 [Helobdella robusta]|uniref:Store-operated calcium entry-associated regulatory factor n=1 Tax=Helobdella robusta TaxID=6412 RepID=T1G9L9_HELRO|nr:hypothetical protein HELRODRAFT_98295 [Helobdella robusta]ESO08194.1 hypothetical protein HELRODRAFT_98295 [Helobdella robusta]
MMKYVFFVCFLATILACVSGHKKVLLKDVQVVTLRNKEYTTGRRNKPIPQLHCLGGFSGCETVTLDTVQCYNRGFDGNDYNWECKADMPKHFKFGKMEVTCEGYDYPDDPYILAGSCGLRYELIDLSDKSGLFSPPPDAYEKKYSSPTSDYKNRHYTEKTKAKDSSSETSPLFIFCIFVGIIVVVLWYSKSRQQAPTSQASDPPAPPPYGFRASPPPYDDHVGSQQPPPPGFNTGFSPPPFQSPPSYGFKTNAGNQQQQQQQQQQPRQQSSRIGGFWTGASLGGLAGYLFGSRRNSNNYGGRDYYDSGSSYFGGSRYRNVGSRGDGWFGSGSSGWGSAAGSTTTTTTSSAPNTETRSGFAETKRR